MPSAYCRTWVGNRATRHRRRRLRARFHAEWMGRIHQFLGLSVGCVLTTQNPQGPERKAAYQADITYGTNNEFGFDYLRDHMVPDLRLCAQRDLHYAIVDEVDNILIDEARTPLIISGQAEESAETYKQFARIVPRLRQGDDYEIDAKTKTVAITDAGIDKIERMLGVSNVYDDIELTRHLENALKAHALFKLDKDYIVRVGTTSVDISEHLSELLEQRGIPHNVLNAKQHAREAQIVAQAGRSGAVTIATNMAGRGTDIMLGGNPDGYVDDILRQRDIDPEFATAEDRAEALAEARMICEADREKVLAAGGLYIIGTERHESRRIDNQLRGRAGRQGDPGESRFFVSLEDDLMRRFGTGRAAGLLERIGMSDDMPIEHKMVTGFIEQAQAKVEGFNFDIRKNVVEYDDVISAQRKVIYTDRQAVLEREDMHERVLEMVDHEIRRVVQGHTTANLPEDWDLDGLVKQFDVWGIQIPDDVFPEQINRLKRDTLIEELCAAGRAAYAAKEAHVVQVAKDQGAVESGEGYIRQFERMVVLQIVDTLWQDHIDQMDVMRSGIGLRGVAQRDPLVEFRREAFGAFDLLKGEIEHQVTEYLFRAPVQIQLKEPPLQAPAQNLRTNAEDIAKLSGQAKEAGASAARPKQLPPPAGGASARVSAQDGSPPNGSRPGPGGASRGGNGARSGNDARSGGGARAGGGQRPAAKAAKGGQAVRQPVAASAAASSSGSASKLGRNDPCYCGSGRKYKMCHGR